MSGSSRCPAPRWNWRPRPCRWNPARIAKTLSFADGEGCLLVVTAGDRKIDNAKFKAAFGMKAKMLPPEEVLRLTGHPVGGVCPFALPEGTRVALDRSLRRFPLVYPPAAAPIRPSG